MTDINRRCFALAIAVVAGALTLAGCTTAPTSASVRTLPTDVAPVPTLTNAGTSAQVADVRDAAVRALTAELHVFDTDEEGKPMMTETEREDLVDATCSGSQRAALEEALEKELGKPPFRRGGEFIVEHWDGIQVVDDHARAYVTGHNLYMPTSASSQKRDDTWQYQLLLVHEDNRWLVTEQRAASNNQG